MPLTLEDFLSREPTLGALRRELDTARAAFDGNRGRRELRRLATEERDLVELLSNRWTRGIAGWMTPDEAAQVARRDQPHPRPQALARLPRGLPINGGAC